MIDALTQPLGDLRRAQICRANPAGSAEWDPETGKIGFSISMELGTTCAELPLGAGDDSETEFGGHFNGEDHPIFGFVKVPRNRTAGRGSLPSTVTPDANPGAPCDGTVNF